MALLMAGTGCGDSTDEAPTGGDSGEGGSGDGDGDGDGDGSVSECDVPIVQSDDDPCVNTGEDNIDCILTDPGAPSTGACAPKGPACQRSSNRAKECLLDDDEPMVAEFRIAQSLPVNMPNSSGLMILADSAFLRSRVCSSEQCLLLRMTIPREGGERVAGEGKAEIRVGHYNCDGTFSFYGDGAAPDRADEGRTGADRWSVRTATTMFDPAKSGPDQMIVTGDDPSREISYGPFYLEGSTDLDWELGTMGFHFTEIDTSVEARDVLGSFNGDTGKWDRPGRYVVYAPIEANDTDIINPLGATYCSLTAFGPLPMALQTTVTCKDTPRCLPDNPIVADAMARVCPYVKLPDSLCPEGDENEMFGCHLGSQTNVNNEEDYPEMVDCTMDEPTEALEDEKGQCCDPLGEGTDGLPACNAYRIVNSFAATAAEITDEPSDDLQPVCN